MQLQHVYSKDSTTPTASASPAGATYTSAKSVTLAASEPATIYYTKDGTTPTTSSAVYSGPISIGTSTTLKFYAKDTAGNIGPVVTQVYTIDTTPPTASASPAGGTYTSAKSVTLTASAPSTIYYTKDGTTPTTSSINGPSPVTISISSNSTLEFFAKDTAGNIGIVVTQVYTINISAPLASNCQNSPIAAVTAIGSDGNIPANAIDGNLTTRWSNLGVGSWIKLDLGTPKTVCNVDIAWYNGNLRSNNFVISTSTDGNTFTGVYAGSSNGTTASFENYDFADVNARYVMITVNGNAANNWASIGEIKVNAGSPPTSDTTPPTVSASPAGGTYSTLQSVTLTASEPSTVYYTIDGTMPDTLDAVYTSPISIGTSTTLKFFAKDTAGNIGIVVTQVYTINTTPPTASASPAGATYTSAQSVTLAASEPATIYYTKDGTTPTTSSAVYSS